MNFFVFAMLTLVLSDNFVGLLIGWGLVGAASYFLIGFWFARPTAVAAARKAFVINVVGDVGLMFAIFVLFATTGSTVYGDVFAKVGEIPHWALILACVTLFVACAAKSAQDSAPHLATRCDGRPDPGLGFDPRGHDGHGRRLFDRALRPRSGTVRPKRACWSGRSAR